MRGDPWEFRISSNDFNNFLAFREMIIIQHLISFYYITLYQNVKEQTMNELERTALNEILRTVTYIAEKLDELDSKISSSDSQVLEHQES